ncbi:nucleotidyltransferase domain-containing protein [archaeon]|nr:nucleotidyltransferase domain-containing protein [archaeon]
MKKPIVPKSYRRIITETGRQRVLEILAKYPEMEFSLSDLAKESGVAKANIGSILDDLQKMNLVEITKLSKIWRIRAKQGSPEFIKNKIIHNLHLVYYSGLVEFLSDYFNNPKCIILFGSFRHGDDVSGSDIDIAIETDKKRDDIIEIKELMAFEKEIGRKIQIHLFNRKNVDLNVFNNIANGIVLSGFLEVKP